MEAYGTTEKILFYILCLIIMGIVLLIGVVMTFSWTLPLQELQERKNSSYYHYIVPFQEKIIKELLEQAHHMEFREGIPVIEPGPESKEEAVVLPEKAENEAASE